MKTEKKNIFYKKILNKGRHHKKKLKIWIFSKRGGGSGGSQLESYGSENSHGKMLKIFGVTVWLTEFC